MHKKLWIAAALTLAAASPLAIHAQTVTIIGEDNPGSSGATRNTTGAGANAQSSGTLRGDSTMGATTGSPSNFGSTTDGRIEGSGSISGGARGTVSGGSAGGAGGTMSGSGSLGGAGVSGGASAGGGAGAGGAGR